MISEAQLNNSSWCISSNSHPDDAQSSGMEEQYKRQNPVKPEPSAVTRGRCCPQDPRGEHWSHIMGTAETVSGLTGTLEKFRLGANTVAEMSCIS